MTPAEENALVSMARPLGATNASRDAIRLAIRAAVAHERERAARVCEETYPEIVDGKMTMLPQFVGGIDCAAAIRRGEP